MFATITATAHSVPKKVLKNKDLEKFVETSDAWIRSRTGIHQRHVVSKNEAASDISTLIARDLLEKSKITADEIDIIIVGTVTPDHFTPSTAAIIQKNIERKIEYVEMPNLIGKTVRDAFSELKKAGIKPQISGRGLIVSQSIKSGIKVEKQSICILKAELKE